MPNRKPKRPKRRKAAIKEHRRIKDARKNMPSDYERFVDAIESSGPPRLKDNPAGTSETTNNNNEEK